MTAGLVCAALLLTSAVAVAAARRAGRSGAVARRLRGGRSGGGWHGFVASLPAAPAWLVPRLEAAAVPVDPPLAWAAWVVLVVVAAAAGALVGGGLLAVVAVVVAAGGPALALLAAGGRRDRRVEAALPEALEAVARSLRSGASLRLAIGEAALASPGALGDDLGRVATEAASGTPLAAALDTWEGRRPLPGVRLAVAALALGAETGGAHARAVDSVAETVRSRLAVAAEVRALSSQARLSGLVIVLAPVVFSGLATTTDGRVADFLFRSPAGLVCLCVGLGLDVVAGLWMHRLSKVEA